jgi:hypothetical protein
VHISRASTAKSSSRRTKPSTKQSISFLCFSDHSPEFNRELSRRDFARSIRKTVGATRSPMGALPGCGSPHAYELQAVTAAAREVIPHWDVSGEGPGSENLGQGVCCCLLQRNPQIRNRADQKF